MSAPQYNALKQALKPPTPKGMARSKTLFPRSIEIAPIVVQWLPIPQPWLLSIDRTNWSFGSHTHSLVMLKKKKGNSNSDERMRFIKPLA